MGRTLSGVFGFPFHPGVSHAYTSAWIYRWELMSWLDGQAFGKDSTESMTMRNSGEEACRWTSENRHRR